MTARFAYQLATLLLTLVFSLRALVPSGYMVSADETSGLVRIELCGLVAHVIEQKRTVWFDPQSGEYRKDVPKPGKKSVDDPCPFSMLSALAAPETPPEIATALAGWFIGSQPICRDVAVSQRHCLLPPPRGPPHAV